MLVAMSLSLGGMAIVIPSVMNGAGRHAAYLDPEVNKLGLKVTYDTATTPPALALGCREEMQKRGDAALLTCPFFLCPVELRLAAHLHVGDTGR